MTTRLAYLASCASLIALVFLCLAWELWLAPLRPGGSWLVLKTLPLLAPLFGLLRGRIYTYQWSLLLVLAYFIEGVVRAWSETGAAAWLEHVLANRLPRPGRMALAPMLNHDGKLIGDFTVANAGGSRYFLFGSGSAEEYHLRWFESLLPASGVALRSLRTEMLGFAIAGPRSRDVLAGVGVDQTDNTDFPFLAFRQTEIATVPVHIGRISFTGELGYEIWAPADCQRTLYEALAHAGAAFNLRHFDFSDLHVESPRCSDRARRFTRHCRFHEFKFRLSFFLKVVRVQRHRPFAQRTQSEALKQSRARAWRKKHGRFAVSECGHASVHTVRKSH